MKTPITEESKVHLQFYEDATKQTLATLPEFLRHLTEDYAHDYGTICHAISAGAIATAHAMDRSASGGLTGFQGDAVMWGFIRGWMYGNEDKPLRLVVYENMLYPQYEEHFNKCISKETMEYLRREAKSKLSESTEHVHPDVLAHWKRIADGVVPFGFMVK